MSRNLVKHCKNKNELEALALSTSNPNAIFFTADTNSIILGGKIFGIGNSLLFIGTRSEYDAAILAGQIPYGTIVIIEDSYLTFTALEDNCSIGFYNNPDASISPTIEYSFDKNNWDVLTNNVSIEKDCLMYCRGINPNGINSGYDDGSGEGSYNYFTGEGKFNVSGDIMSLINYETPPKAMVGTFYNLFGGFGEDEGSPRDNFVDIVDASKLMLSATALTSGCYYNMFACCTSLTTAPALPATELADMCYAYMFALCSSLTSAPALPATEVAIGCYGYMFAGCTSLTIAPDLPAATLALMCYAFMFAGCTSLTTAPELSVTILTYGCYYYMFYGCTSLTVAPELPATLLAEMCYTVMFGECTSLAAAPSLPATVLSSGCYYYMFGYCTSLAAAPSLPATSLADSCYSYMFEGCTSLTAAPTLSAMELAYDCYSGMFSGCTSLTAAPTLSATTLVDECYNNMFYYCTSLTTAPALPATTLTYRCYDGMFSGCTSLSTAPVLPAMVLADHCYEEMFRGCTSLTTTPELNATTLANSCYSNMFEGCTSLTTAPELNATTLANSCYSNMFKGCTSLTTAPMLPATTLAYSCYNGMFSNCTNINHIACLATAVPYYYTNNWVEGVASTGTFVKHPDMDDWPIGTSGIPRQWIIEDALMSYVTFTAELDRSSIGLEHLSTNQILEYSTDTTTWKTFNTETNISLNNGDKLYVRGILSANNTVSDYTQFNMGGKIAASGNCNAIWNYEDLEAPLKSYCGYYMFQNCTALTATPELPATVLADGCYSNMFHSCTSLTTTHELPATTLTLGCYASMFYNCTALTAAPELPATELVLTCYYQMFLNCTTLNCIKCLATDISAADCTFKWVEGVASTGIFFKHPNMTNWSTGINGIPSGWTIEYMSYVTFTSEADNGSIRLDRLSTNQTLEYSTDTTNWNTFDMTTNISINKGDKVYIRGILSADNTGSNYTTFNISGKIAASGNCNAIWNYQDLNAPLKAYCGYQMFYGKQLTSAPDLPATTLAQYCYAYMFAYCSYLTSAPKILPATELASICYASMFYNCTSLRAAPDLPATTLANFCYDNMFTGCAKLNYIKCLATDISSTGCTNNWVDGVASEGTFVKHQDMTNWSTGISGIPSDWTINNLYTPQECVKLEITADNVFGRKTNTTIYYTATTNGIYDNGDRVEGQIITGTATSDEFEQNKSYTDTVERTITFEFMGVTATTTITQGVWVDASYKVVLNNQWRLSETQSNPDSTLYDGVYESFSNKGVDNSTATMCIDLTGYAEFDIYIRSYAESSCDYVTISEPNSTTEKASTKGNQNSGLDINSYTIVHYDNLTGHDRIIITYRKDVSVARGNDQGYILIPKQ